MLTRMISLNGIHTIQNDTEYETNRLVYFTNWKHIATNISLDAPNVANIYEAEDLPVEMVVWSDGVIDFNDMSIVHKLFTK